MDVWTLTRSVLCLLVVALATGCGTLRGSRTAPVVPPMLPDPGNANTAPNDASAGGYAQPGIPGGTVVAAGGAVRQTPDGAALPPPRPLPVPPVWAAGVPLPPGGQPPQMTPPAPVPGYTPQPPPLPPGSGGLDSHQRNYPTVTGGRLNLGPTEIPADRVVELAKHLETVLAQNRDLLARIRELEALGVGREQALAEAVREIDIVTADAAKTRAALQAQVLALQGKIKQLEEEDVEFLREVLKALNKLVPPEKKP